MPYSSACVDECDIRIFMWQNAVVTTWVMMTWPSICPFSLRCALIDGLVVAVYRAMTYRRIAISFAAGPRTIGSAVLDNPYVEVHSRELQLEGSLAVASGRCSSLETYVIWPNILAHGPLITYEQDVNCKSALYTFHNRRQLIMCVRARCIYISSILNNWQDAAFSINRSTASKVYVHISHDIRSPT